MRNAFPKIAQHVSALITEEIIIHKIGERTGIGSLKTALELHKFHFGQAGKKIKALYLKDSFMLV